jgi:hypothetical protein
MSLMVTCGFSSITQWPEFGTVAPVTSVAAKRISTPSIQGAVGV